MAARIVLVVGIALVVAVAASAFERNEEDLCITRDLVLPEQTEIEWTYSLAPPGQACVFTLPDGTTVTDAPRFAPLAWALLGALVLATLLVFRRSSEPVRAATAALPAIVVTGLAALAVGGFFLPFVLGSVVGVPVALVLDGGRRIAPALYAQEGLIALAFFTLAGLQSLAVWPALLLVMATGWATRFARPADPRPAPPPRR